MIEHIIDALENLSRNDLRNILRNNLDISHILRMDSTQLLDFCNRNYDKYFRLRIQISKIYMFDVTLRDFGIALSIHNNLLQIIELNKDYMKFEFDILYLKTLIYHFSHNREKSYALARMIYDSHYSQSDEKRNVLIYKLLGLTTPELDDAINYSERVLQFLKETNGNVTEIGWIYKNLAFYYLKSEQFSKSISNLKNFVKIAPSMDEPESFTLLVLSGYIEKLNEINQDQKMVSTVNRINKLKRELGKIVSDFENISTNRNIMLNKISDIFDTSKS